jgi:predicted porin
MKTNQNKPKTLWFATLLAFAGGAQAQAQSNVATYGLLETGLRYSTHQNGAGDGQWQIGDGVLNPSRIGFSGSEDLGGGLKASFTLEAGLQLKNGSSVNAAFGTLNNDDASKSRLFGRLAYVGLSGDFGSLNLGRQYTTAFLSACNADPICGGGMVVWSPYLLYTSLRQDNLVTYQKGMGPVTFNAHYTAGEQAGDFKANSGYGVGLDYANKNLLLSTAYQRNELPAFITAKLFTANMAYAIGPAKLMFGYVGNKMSGASTQENKVFYGGVSYTATQAWTLTGSVYRDKQVNGDGKHFMAVAVADYAFSKRTSTYLEVDYNKYRDAMRPFGATGPDDQRGVTLGLRHKF